MKSHVVELPRTIVREGGMSRFIAASTTIPTTRRNETAAAAASWAFNLMLLDNYRKALSPARRLSTSNQVKSEPSRDAR